MHSRDAIGSIQFYSKKIRSHPISGSHHYAWYDRHSTLFYEAAIIVKTLVSYISHCIELRQTSMREKGQKFPGNSNVTPYQDIPAIFRGATRIYVFEICLFTGFNRIYKRSQYFRAPTLYVCVYDGRNNMRFIPKGIEIY